MSGCPFGGYMQRFLISSSVGGARLTKAALEFILRTATSRTIESFEASPNPHSEDEWVVYATYQDGDCIGDPLYTEWFNLFRKGHIYSKGDRDMKFDDIPPDASVSLPLDSELRDLIVFSMPISLYDSCLPMEYVAKLDELNDMCEIRIVSVPDGYHCHIVAHEENFNEWVEEYTRVWGTGFDAESFTIEQIKRFASREAIHLEKLLDNEDVIEFQDLLIARKGNLAVAYSKLTSKVTFLKKACYCKETGNHPMAWFEIVGGDDVNYKFQQSQIFFDMETVNTYYRLARKVSQSAHDLKAKGKLPCDVIDKKIVPALWDGNLIMPYPYEEMLGRYGSVPTASYYYELPKEMSIRGMCLVLISVDESTDDTVTFSHSLFPYIDNAPEHDGILRLLKDSFHPVKATKHVAAPDMSFFLISGKYLSKKNIVERPLYDKTNSDKIDAICTALPNTLILELIDKIPDHINEIVDGLLVPEMQDAIDHEIISQMADQMTKGENHGPFEKITNAICDAAKSSIRSDRSNDESSHDKHSAEPVQEVPASD